MAAMIFMLICFNVRISINAITVISWPLLPSSHVNLRPTKITLIKQSLLCILIEQSPCYNDIATSYNLQE